MLRNLDKDFIFDTVPLSHYDNLQFQQHVLDAEACDCALAGSAVYINVKFFIFAIAIYFDIFAVNRTQMYYMHSSY